MGQVIVHGRACSKGQALFQNTSMKRELHDCLNREPLNVM